VKKAFNDIRNLDLAGALEKHVDPDRSIRNTFADNPLAPTYPTASPAVDEVSTLEEVTVSAPPVVAPVPELPEPDKPLAPAFIPPGMVPPPDPVVAAQDEAPAFIPPEAVLQRKAGRGKI
jgi:sec-independent protein translocase protein TatB